MSRSAFVWGSIATDSDGSGKSIGGRTIGLSFEDSVSPVSVATSFATAPISPAWSSPMGSWSLPWRSSSWPIRSSSSRPAFQEWAWLRSVPLSTRRYVSRPTNGSAAVLKTRATSGPAGSGVITTGAPDLASFASTAGSSAAVGMYRMNASRSAFIPIPFVALPTRTGARMESRTPRWRHVSSSSSLTSSPSRYLAMTSSSASAAASRS